MKVNGGRYERTCGIDKEIVKNRWRGRYEWLICGMKTKLRRRVLIFRNTKLLYIYIYMVFVIVNISNIVLIH